MIKKVAKAENIKEDALKEYISDFKNKRYITNSDLIMFEPISRDRVEQIFPGGKPTREIAMGPSVYTAMKKYAITASVPETSKAAEKGTYAMAPIEVTRHAGKSGKYFKHLDNAAPRPFTYHGMDVADIDLNVLIMLSHMSIKQRTTELTILVALTIR